jgi:beta-lactamase class A
MLPIPTSAATAAPWPAAGALSGAPSFATLPPAPQSTAKSAPAAPTELGRPTALAASPVTGEPTEPPTPPAPSAPKPTTPAHTINPVLDADVTGIINANEDFQIGVALIDLRDGLVHRYGVDEPFEAASTAKVLAAAAYYHLVETGGATLDEPMGDYTSEYQLREMIQNSDNDAWAMIMDAVGYEQLRDYAASIGVSYDSEINELRPAEMATILADLYSGKLLNQGDTEDLLSFMRDTNFESLIPAATPADVTVFHKYGLLDSELHDAGILAKGADACAFVVYTRGTDGSDIPERTDIIHQLTEAVVKAAF